MVILVVICASDSCDILLLVVRVYTVCDCDTMVTMKCCAHFMVLCEAFEVSKITCDFWNLEKLYGSGWRVTNNDDSRKRVSGYYW